MLREVMNFRTSFELSKKGVITTLVFDAVVLGAFLAGHLLKSPGPLQLALAIGCVGAALYASITIIVAADHLLTLLYLKMTGRGGRPRLGMPRKQFRIRFFEGALFMVITFSSPAAAKRFFYLTPAMTALLAGLYGVAWAMGKARDRKSGGA